MWLFLVLLTLLVFARLARSEEFPSLLHAGAAARTSAAVRPEATLLDGAPKESSIDALDAAPARGRVSVSVEGDIRIVLAGGTLNRMLVVGGLRPGRSDYVLVWETLQGTTRIAGGRVPFVSARGTTTRVAISVPVPAPPHPSALDLRLEVLEAGQAAGSLVLPLTVYPENPGAAILERLATGHAALYDPEGRAAAALRGLGLRWEVFRDPEALALYEGDLVVVGPRGFARGRETLGPILAARAGAGMNVLVLDQPTMPGTLSDDLHLWQAFARSGDARTILATTHPLLSGIRPEEAGAYFAAAAAPPLVAPIRGNFRVIAQTRVRSGPQWQEGVRALEIDLGRGSALFIQASLCADAATDPRARVLLVNALAFLLAARPAAPNVVVYGRSPEDLPACVTRLQPRVTRAGSDLRDAGIVLVPADWRAPMVTMGATLPARAEVARFLRDGGTVVLLQPHPQSDRYIATLTGAQPAFAGASGLIIAGVGAVPRTDRPGAALASSPDAAGALPPILDGIATEDLALLHHPDNRDFALRASAGGAAVEPILVHPGLAVYRVGRGTLVSLPLPDADECAAPRISSLVARLLTNLGVPLATPDPPEPAAASLAD